MTPLDRWIQRLRISQARRFIPQGARLLDIGCDDGALFRQVGDLLADGVGIEPTLAASVALDRFQLLPGIFPDAIDSDAQFEVITMLAVLEHIPPEEQARLVDGLERHLAPGGLLIITVPSPRVDQILGVLTALRLVHGMSVEQHYGFDPSQVPELFRNSRLRLHARKSFQLGLNHLFVFSAP